MTGASSLPASALRGPAKRSSSPAMLHPGQQLRRFRGAVTGRSASTITAISRCSSVCRSPPAQLGERRQRPLQVVQRAHERRVRPGLRRHEAYRPPAKPLVPAAACHLRKLALPAAAG